MHRITWLPAIAALLALTGAPARADPVTVTRFIAPDAALAPAQGTIVITTAPGLDPAALDLRPWLDAVAHELAAKGFAVSSAANPDRIVEVRVERTTAHIDRTRGPVSVGVGGDSGGYRSGFGLGIGFSLGGGPKDLVTTRLVVVVRDRASGNPLWEARAENTENLRGKRGGVDVAAPRLAAAAFTGFPGRSGQTITVK
ncbi:DUF4136 domain-containing protein [Novosphingobium sp.]|uniref:DUF4136 domain-containing protein n=1 Tax=Novosphingobium sp. TaxID=1874826 RepID=UPI00333E9377